jgi:hypothetical protein
MGKWSQAIPGAAGLTSGDAIASPSPGAWQARSKRFHMPLRDTLQFHASQASSKGLGTVSIWRSIFGGRRTQSRSGPPAEPLLINAYATVRDMPDLAFPHEFRAGRDLSDEELAPHVDDFIGYLMGRGDGQMTAIRYQLWRHLQRVRHQVSFDAVYDTRVESWARAANAVLFLTDGSVRAPDMTVLMSAEGETDPAAALPYPPDTVERRARTLARLAGVEPRPPVSMMPAIGEAEVMPQSASATLGRALAALYVAAHGQSVGVGNSLPPEGRAYQNRLGHSSLSAHERTLILTQDRDEATIVAMTWRYEAANALLWALGVEGANISTNEKCDPEALWRSVEFLAQGGSTTTPLRLRPASELLDALDQTWREHWIVQEAQRRRLPVPANLNGGIIRERHTALNWLTHFQNDFGAHWDDIETPT